MQKKLLTSKGELCYVVKKKKGVKNIRLSVDAGGFSVSAPWYVPSITIESFVQKKREWIEKTIEGLKKDRIDIDKEYGAHYLRDKARARRFIKERLHFYNEYYQFDYNRIFIKNQKGAWGSCSSLKNLNFNFRLVYLPLELADYVIVHELCHLKEMNHSKKFWDLVLERSGDYKMHIRKLNKYQIN